MQLVNHQACEARSVHPRWSQCDSTSLRPTVQFVPSRVAQTVWYEFFTFEFDILDLLTSVHYSGLSSALEGHSSRKSCIGRVFSNLLLRRGVGAGLDEGRLLDGHFFHSPEP